MSASTLEHLLDGEQTDKYNPREKVANQIFLLKKSNTICPSQVDMRL